MKGPGKGYTNSAATMFKKGISGNPGGRPKQVLSLLKFCRKRTPKALALCEKLIDDEVTSFDEARDMIAYKKLRLEAAKFLATYGMGAPPKYDTRDDGVRSANPAAPLTTERLEAIARARLSSERPDEPDAEH